MAESDRPLNVLVADDEKVCREILRLFLAGLGCRVQLVASGSDALAAFSENIGQIDLVILDVQMPGPGSRDLFTAIRGLDPAVPVLFCSGVFADGPEVRPTDAPRTAFLPKPFTRRQLADILDSLVGAAA